MPVFLDPPVDVTPATFGVYTDVDVSAHVPAGAVGVAVHVINTDASNDRAFGLRRNGETTVDNYNDLDAEAHNWPVVALDDNGIFEARLASADLFLELVAYFEADEAEFPAVPPEITPAWTAGFYSDIDLSAIAPDALAAFVLFRPIATPVFARAKGSSAALDASIDNRQTLLCGVSAEGLIQAVSGSTSQRLFLTAWLNDGFVVDDPPVDVTPGQTATWETHKLPAGATGAVFWARNLAFTSNLPYGARKKGSGLDWKANTSERAGFAIVGADANQEVEIYAQFAGGFGGVSVYRLGYFFEADDYEMDFEPVECAVEVEPVEFVANDIAFMDLEAVECAVEVEPVEFTNLAVDQRLPVIALLALPFDPTVEIAMQGPPVPAASVPATDIAFTSLGAEVVVAASDESYESQPGDDPASLPFYPRLLDTASFDLRAFAGDRPGDGSGLVDEALGALKLANGDGRYDAAALLGWDGRTVELWSGRKGMAFRDFNILLRGTAERVAFDEGSITIALRQRGAVLEQPVNAAVYGGSGGMDGHDGIVGLNKPVAWGRCLNVEGVMIDPVNLVSQFHDGQLEAVDELRDKGAALTATVDVADYDALLAETLAAGEYATCLVLGIVRLGGAPLGRVTADLRGDAADGYVETTADIARRIVSTRLGGGNLAGSDLDEAAISALAAAQPAPVGYWVGTTPETARDVLDRLLGGIGGWYGFTRDGRFTVARLSLDGASLETLTPRETAARLPAEKRTVQPVWQVRVAWGHVWQVQSGDDLVDPQGGAISEDDRAFWSREARYAVEQDFSLRGRHRLARSLTVEGYFAERSDAETESSRLMALYGPDREIWTFGRADRRLGRRWIGDMVTLDLGRYGQPKPCQVIGLREDYGNVEIDLVLWG